MSDDGTTPDDGPVETSGDVWESRDFEPGDYRERTPDQLSDPAEDITIPDEAPEGAV